MLSRANLPLASVDYRIGDGTWWSATLLGAASGEGCVVELPHDPAEIFVRAPGHLATLVTSDRVELPPDALLEIEMPGLAEAVTKLDLPADFGPAIRELLEECSSFGFTGANAFAIAVDVPCFLGRFPNAHLEVGFQLGDHERILVDARLDAGLRARAVLPDLVSKELQAPVHVRMRRESDASPSGTTALTVWAASKEQDLPRWSFEWGTVALHAKVKVQEFSVTGNEATTAALMLGRKYRIAALHDATGAAGSVEFTHRGAAVEIELLPGIRLFGVFDGDGKSLPETARARWTWSKPDTATDDGEYRWLNGSGPLPIDPGGAFAVIAPRQGFPGRPPRSEPPSSVTLRFAVSGFAELELAVDLAGRHAVDLGTLTLQSDDPDLTLATHPFRGPDALRWSTFQACDGSLPGSFEVAWVRPLDDGGLEVFLQRAEGAEAPADFSFRHAEGGKWVSVAYPRPVPEIIVVHGRREGRDGAVPTLFELTHREPLPSYDWIPGRPRRVTVEFLGVAPEIESVSMGWSWRDAFVRTKSLHDELALERSFEFTFDAPDGAAFWWTWKTESSFVWPPVSSRRLVDDTELVTIPE